MATANDKLLNELVAHAIDLQGYSNNVVKKMIALLNSADADLVEQLKVAMDKLPASQFNADRLTKLLAGVREVNTNIYTQITDGLSTELRDLTEYELGYQKQLLASTLPQAAIATINVNEVYAAAMAKPFSGKLLKEFLSGMESKRIDSVRDAVRMGYIESQTVGEIVKRIRGTKALNYADGLLQVSRRDAEAIVTTAINHTGNFAREALYDKNSDIIKAVRYTATLDMRTTQLCASRDGLEFKLGKPKPAIPAHIRCRSLYVPVLKSWRELGINADEIPDSTRASLDGQVPAKLTYGEWLFKQSPERQNRVLGIDKAELFRSGKLSFDKFVSPLGHSYTLAELKKLHPDVFT